MMWRPDRSVHGPDRATGADVEPLNRLFTEAFTDRYARDGLVGRAGAAAHAGGLALRDRGRRRGRHAVARRRWPARGVQHGAPLGHRGVDGADRGPARPAGRAAWVARSCRRASSSLRSRGATTIGLETMPRTTDNIGFYGTLGLRARGTSRSRWCARRCAPSRAMPHASRPATSPAASRSAPSSRRAWRRASTSAASCC